MEVKKNRSMINSGVICIKTYKIYLFVAVQGLCCCVGFLLLQIMGLFFVAICGLLIVVASLVTEHGL